MMANSTSDSDRIRLLQVNNVASVLGGTGQCAASIYHALPDFDHHVFFFGGGPTPEIGATFARAQLHFRTSLTPMVIESIAPDVIIFHNTGEPRMPKGIPADILTIYYQHSASMAATVPRNQCHIAWGNSKYLCKLTNIHPDWCVYQPVHMPDVERKPIEGKIRIGRICTPASHKWPEDTVARYQMFAKRFPEVEWHFVGCPAYLQEGLAKATNGIFHAPSTSARKLYYEWDAMLYQSECVETYGRIVAEAQLAGCMPIVSNHSGLAEQISHAADGFLCANDDEFVWAIKMCCDRSRLDELRPVMIRSGNRRSNLDLWRRNFLSWLEAVLDESD